MKKQLIINNMPPVKPYQHNAYVESILYSHKDYNNWIANNYIQVMAYKYNNRIGIDYLSGSIFGSVPLLDFYSLDKEEMFNSEYDVHNDLKEWIDSNKYIYTFLDEFYIPKRNAFNKFHFNHDSLIYGYDNDKRIYNIVGFDSSGNYSISEISFEILYRAICNENICLILLKLKEIDYNFDIDKFTEMLLDYTQAKDCRDKLSLYLDMESYNEVYYDNKFNNAESFGINIYSCFNEILEFCAINKSNLDYRNFYLLYEHKLNMLSKIKYLKINNFLKNTYKIEEEFNKLINMAGIILRLSLKYNMNHDQQILMKIYGMLSKAEVIEKAILHKVTDQLQGN